MDKMDFQNAGIKHLIWKKRLRGLLDGKIIVSEVQQMSHKECELGLWLYATGLKEHGDLKEMRQLEANHIEMHAIGNKIIRFHDSGKDQEAEEEYEKLDELSKKIIGILTILAVQIDTEGKGQGK